MGAAALAAADQPGRVQRRVAVGGRAAHRPPARRLARRLRASPTPGRCGTATGAAPARSTSPRRSPGCCWRSCRSSTRATCGPTPAPSCVVYYGLALLVAAPGAGCSARGPAARRLAGERRMSRTGAGAAPDDARRPRRAARDRGRDLPARPLALPRADRDRPAVRVDDQGAADRGLPRRELLGLDHARDRLRRRARLGARPGVRAAVPDRRASSCWSSPSSTSTSSTWTTSPAGPGSSSTASSRPPCSCCSCASCACPAPSRRAPTRCRARSSACSRCRAW